jgi:hypothetical protein
MADDYLADDQMAYNQLTDDHLVVSLLAYVYDYWDDKEGL